MDHVLENKFLNKEGAFKQNLNEVEDTFDEDILLNVDSKEQAVYQIVESFIKEKNSLLSYLESSVIYSAKITGIDASLLYPQEILDKAKIIKDEAEMTTLRNRIIMIVS